ncbi:DsbA family protein [Kordiimonas marina]|uniref:DsbA family protein n=1 Tax=Kordiimonas marina TaxID=2872312 RepID=UPI001FF493B2|nr:DsbA family protein [Kordiimonas marina]MCJ9428968.1 DsbA family protein [Kordiimonas marina]
MIKFAKSLLVAGLMLAPTVSAAAQDMTPAERAKIETVVHDYLMQHPEVIIQSIQELQRRQTVAQMLPTINLYRDYLEHEKGAPVLGNPNGDVTIVEFFDYRCPYCKHSFPVLQKLMKEDGNIRLVPRQYPILDRPGAPAVSLMAAKAALASNLQGKFAEFHDALMAYPDRLTEDGLYKVAASVGLNVDKLKADMKDKMIEKSIQNTLAIGKDIGFNGTPGYIVGDDIILGAEGYDRLKQAVDRARADAAKKAKQ